MATQTKVLASGSDADGGVATLEVDYDDATLRLIAVRCVNQTAGTVYAALVQTSNGRLVDHVFPVGTTTITIPNNAAQKVLFSSVVRNRLDGVELTFKVPGP